jgi:hypothetical protein
MWWVGEVDKETFKKAVEEELGNVCFVEDLEDIIKDRLEKIDKEKLTEEDIDEFFEEIGKVIPEKAKFTNTSEAIEFLKENDGCLTDSLDVAMKLGYTPKITLTDFADIYLQEQLATETEKLLHSLEKVVNLEKSSNVEEMKNKLIQKLKEELEDEDEYPYLTDWVDEDELIKAVKKSIKEYKKDYKTNEIKTPEDYKNLFFTIYDKLTEIRDSIHIYYDEEAYDVLEDLNKLDDAIEMARNWGLDISKDLNTLVLATILKEKYMKQGLEELKDFTKINIEMKQAKKEIEEEQKNEEKQKKKSKRARKKH